MPGAFYYDAATDRIRVGTAAAINYEKRPSHEIVLRIVDGELTVVASLTVTVNNVNDPPTPHCPHLQVPESSPARSVLTDAVTVLDEDVADQTFTYRLVKATEAFTIDSTGRLVLQAALDYEFRSTYTLQVEVMDTGGATGSCTLFVDVLDVDEAPTGPTSYSGSIHQGAAKGEVVLKIELEDPEHKALSYRFVEPAPLSVSGKPMFAVATGGFLVVDTSDAFNFSSPTSYELRLSGSDGFHEVPFSCAVTLVQDTPPIACPTRLQRMDVAENAVEALVGYVSTISVSSSLSSRVTPRFQLLGSAASSPVFTLNATTGEVRVAAQLSLDYESRNEYDLSFDAFYANNLKITCSFTVHVIDQDEPPVCGSIEVSLAENQAGNDIMVAQLNATDPESKALTFAVDATATTIRGAYVNRTGAVFLRDLSVIDFEVSPRYSITVVVSEGSNSVKCTVAISVQDTNDCPVVSKQTLFVLENSVIGTLVGNPVAVADQDHPDGSAGRITFAMESTEFAIHSTTGQISVADALALDFEMKKQFQVVVFVTDDGNPSCTSNATLEINVQDVNELPTVGGWTGGASRRVYTVAISRCRDRGGEGARI